MAKKSSSRRSSRSKSTNARAANRRTSRSQPTQIRTPEREEGSRESE